MKMLQSEDPRHLEEAQKETNTLKKLKHKNIIGYINSFMKDEHFCIIMELAHSDLLKIIREQHKKGEPFKKELIWEILTQITSGMAYLHKQKVLHRDLKPANLLVRGEIDAVFEIKIADLGLARAFEGDEVIAETECGTRPYMSKEAYSGSYSFASDVWSIGCILYELWYHLNCNFENSKQFLQVDCS